MMNVLVEKTEVVQDELHQECRHDYKTLKAAIKAQRDENEILYKSLKQVLKETESQKAKINVFQAKIEELEQHVGILANSPDQRFTTHPPIDEVDTSGEGRSNKMLDASGQYYGGQDRTSHQISGQDPGQEGLEFDDGDGEVAKVINEGR